MAELGKDVARLVRLAYLSVDGSTTEVIRVNAFLDALPGLVSEIKLLMVWGLTKEPTGFGSLYHRS